MTWSRRRPSTQIVTGEFPYDVVRQMGRMGLFGLPFPEQYGGMGGDFLALCLAIEELGRIDSSVAITLEAGRRPRVDAGLPVRHRGAATGVAPGALCRAGATLAAFGLTEPGGGSDAGNPRTRAALDGGEWVINGSKAFITNSGTDITNLRHGAVPDRRAASGRSSPEPHSRSWCRCRSLASQRRRSTTRSAGTPATPVSCRSRIVGCHEDNVLGERGRGYAQFLSTLDEGRVAISALAVGLAQACVDESVGYAKQREAFGSPIGSYQAVAFRIADMAVRTHVARCAYRDAASRMLAGQSFKREAAIAKLYSSTIAVDNARDATQVFGGYGFMNEFAVARHWRDSKILEIGEGTSEIQRMLIARDLGL